MTTQFAKSSPWRDFPGIADKKCDEESQNSYKLLLAFYSNIRLNLAGRSFPLSVTYSETCQASKMEHFSKIVNGWNFFTNLEERSILDIWQDSKNVSDCSG